MLFVTFTRLAFMKERGVFMSQCSTDELQKVSKPDTFITVPADPRLSTPEPATKDLVWSVDGNTIPYCACASHIDVRSDTCALIAKMFSLSYVMLEEGKPNVERPVTFLFNGGPGCASVPINFGGMGPLRTHTNEMTHLGLAQTSDNPHTLLKESDLVFLDAPGTGWSSFAEGADPQSCFGVDGDADAFCRAIMQWLEENGRWSSPVFLFGESYGTVRNSVLMRLLGERSVHVAGVIMLSAIFDWVQTLPGQDLYYLGMLPTFAATAQYFKKTGVGIDEDEWFDQAIHFTEMVYAPALLKGDRLTEDELSKTAKAMSEYIGLSAEYIAEKQLRVDLTDFRYELLRKEGKICGRLDMRFTTDRPNSVQMSDGGADLDPSGDAFDSAWTRAFRSFCHDTLGYRPPNIYLGMNYYNIGPNWNWKHEGPGTGNKAGAPNVTYDIAQALRQSPTTKLAIIGGRFDAATTLWNTIHDMSRLFLSEDLKKNVFWYRYGTGHMAYTDVPSLEQMDKDLHEFYQIALGK